MSILPSLTFVYDRQRRSSTTHEGVIELRIIYGRKSKYMITGVKCLPQHWRGGKGGVWVHNRVDAQELNTSLDNIMVNTRKMVNAVLDEAGSFSFAGLVEKMKHANGDKITFVEFCMKRSKVRKYGKQKDTQERYDRFLRWFIAWGKIEYFSDVTEENIMAMDLALKDTGMKDYSKWQNYHRFLNSFIKDAIDEGYISHNPYKWLHIEKDKTSGLHKHLTLEELHQIEQAEMPTESLSKVRDLFVFQAYTCMAYVDMCNFDAGSVVEGVYSSNRAKTGKEFTFLLLEPAKKILEKYDNKLPIISNEKYNTYLKAVAQFAGIDKPLTTHWARHTGATVLLNDGRVKEEVIAKILGSSTRQIRETYAKMLDDTIAKEMGKIEKDLSI